MAGPHLSRGGGRRAQHRGEENEEFVKASWDPHIPVAGGTYWKLPSSVHWGT